MGALLDTSMQSLTGNADFASDFNMIFDPEAAHIVLTAPWHLAIWRTKDRDAEGRTWTIRLTKQF